MVNLFKKYYIPVLAIFVIVTSFVLAFHNVSLYKPNHGFDGSGHVYYINYLYKNRQIPPPTEWETHQPPLYYILGATVMSFTGNIKTPQYINIFILWLIISMVGLGLYRVFKNKYQTLLGMLSLAALPMLNIFPAMVTNELLSTFFIVSAVIACLFLVTEKNQKNLVKITLWLSLSLILGVWTKISIITILPTIAISYALVFFRKNAPQKRLFISGFIVMVVFILAYAPIFYRGAHSDSPSNVVRTVSKIDNKLPLYFFFRLDWIPKVDMYNTQYYSLIGGAWNSFWSDGHNVITPFVSFHKKAFVLWTLGFILLPLCLFGLTKIHKKDKKVSIVLNTVGISMLIMYVLYNIMSAHYSAARLTYEMAIIVPYAFGIAAAAKSKKLLLIITALLFIQFIIMVSFYWILPWWFVTT